jgi:hypothetical protein
VCEKEGAGGGGNKHMTVSSDATWRRVGLLCVFLGGKGGQAASEPCVFCVGGKNGGRIGCLP